MPTTKTTPHSSDPRRQLPVTIEWRTRDKLALLSIGGRRWSEVEWSEKRRAWCIQDAEGRCLRHVPSIVGTAPDKQTAIALAEAMIRDGRLPSPEDAHQAREERLQRDRERRAKQPSVIARRELRQQEEASFRAKWDAEAEVAEADEAEPLYGLIADVFDLADPNLWKRNSFSRLRDRLVLLLKQEIAEIESDQLRTLARQSKKQMKQTEEKRFWKEQAARLQRAQELLKLLSPDRGAL